MPLPAESAAPSQKRRRRPEAVLPNDPLWYKDAIVYQLHVRTFFDGNGDGMGDFAGATARLGYLQDLGVNAVWVLPFYPSPWRDDGYDIADYTDVHPAYGTLSDFRYFLDEAHRRGIRVITELVINHTSDQHPWFQRARRARPGSKWRDFYVWSDTPDRYADARIIFQDFEASNWTWDPIARAYFWHRFYSQQPDLNFDNPAVHDAVLKAMDFWFRIGVDGMRLDAIPYLYEREGTNCENLPETHGFLRLLRKHVDEKWPNRMLLGEANQWPEDAVAYFGDGDECHMAFHFPVMPRLYMGVQMEDRFPVVDILEQTPPIPPTCKWAIFLRNHDELTLEMVTDEERDYMYRTYARDRQMRVNVGIRRRLAPLLGNDRRKTELMNALLFSLPGTPIVYYGDEIGMGDNIYLGDRNGVRTPMQWSAERNAGFSSANPQKLYLPVIIDPVYHYEAINVEVQRETPGSLLWWMRRMIALRSRFRAFSRGDMRFLFPENRKVLAFVRTYEEERILVVVNLSRHPQAVELDLSEWQGMRPVELTGGSAFRTIGEGPYMLTLGAYGFYWFALEQERREEELAEGGGDGEAPVLQYTGDWDELLLRPARRAALEAVLARYLPRMRWFGGKAKGIRSVAIQDALPVRSGGGRAYLTLLRVTADDESADTYVLPLAVARGAAAERIRQRFPQAVVARLRDPARASQHALLFDAFLDPDFAKGLLSTVALRRQLRGTAGSVHGQRTAALPPIAGAARSQVGAVIQRLTPSIVRAEQSNTSVIYGDRLILKLFRRLEEGINPDLEVGAYLTERGFQHTAPVAGALTYQRTGGESLTLGILQGYVQNEGDAWSFTLDELGLFYERVMNEPAPVTPEIRSHQLLAQHEAPATSEEFALLGPYAESVRLLARRTAEMHLSLAAPTDDRDFAPEPFGELYQRALYQSMRNLTSRVLQTLDRQADALPPEVQRDARRVLALRDALLNRFRQVVGRKMSAVRIRVHGDYHLGQVLYTGRDFVIIDFEGEPARPLGERRIKRGALADVAGMLRSFHYAAYTGLMHASQEAAITPKQRQRLDAWARFWTQRISALFLASYLETAQDAAFLPRRREELEILLDVYLLGKAVYELGYELNNRPDWVRIPVQGVLQLLG